MAGWCSIRTFNDPWPFLESWNQVWVWVFTFWDILNDGILCPTTRQTATGEVDMRVFPIAIKQKSLSEPWLHCTEKLTFQVFATGDKWSFQCFLGLIGCGKTHISTVAALAQAQNKDSRPVPAVAAFASLGSYGAHASNQERDLHRWLRNLHGSTMELYYTDFKLEVGV